MAKSNQQITMKGNKIHVRGKEVKEGEALPLFSVTTQDMADLDLSSLKGTPMVIATVPSIDTPVCSIESKRFNQEMDKFGSAVKTIIISRDLPFAQKRWCGAEGVTNVTVASDYKHRSAGESLGVELPDLGLLARAVFVADKEGKVAYVEYVSEVTEEPDFAAAIGAVEKIVEK